MAVYRRNARPRFVLLLLVLTAITLVTVDTRANGGGLTGQVRTQAQDIFSPVQSATHAVLRPVGDFFTGAFGYGSLKAENARLRDQLAQARGQALQAADAQRELALLSAQAHLDFVGNIPTVVAQVVDTTSSNFELSVQINKGTDNGIAVNMPVVTGGGLVGRVADVSSRRATVLLVTDPTFSVGVRASSDGAVFIADGAGRGNPMNLELVTGTTKLNVGDKLVTSGMQLERYPKGIPVATVASVKVDPSQLQGTVTVTPTVDLSRLEYLQVLQWSPQS
ncbi:MAG: rod shape-determining protein MreC [Actinomycetota bacterium]|nr:rod shape-determining protein MreC [Actinomycetota bacterium]